MLIISMACLLPALSFGQRLGFVTSTPRIDSFPNVRLKMTAHYNGSLPQPGIDPSNLVVTEDNLPVKNLQLTDCDESAQAAIVFCVDCSTSITYSAGNTWVVYNSYFNSYAKFISAIPAGSKYALVCFTDTAIYFPGQSRPGGFYSGQTPNDSSDFENNLRNQPFKGFTNVDNALYLSAQLLQYQPYKQKAIVLVTDDGIIETTYFDSLFDAMGITLYNMEIGADGAPLNATVTHETGGIYMEAKDSAQWSPTMQQIEELIFGEHCIIHYISANPCPWVNYHNISLTLNYKSLTKTIFEQYYLGHNIFDVDPPVFTVTSPVYITRLVAASEDYPCTRGLKYFSDSSLANFKILTELRTMPKIAHDSLLVIDTMQPARAVYSAVDSANNKARQEVLYAPKADTLAPEIVFQKLPGSRYRMLVTEVRPWDRGLKTMTMQAGAQNIVLDSFTIISRRVGEAWLHKPDPLGAIAGCFEAIDSSGNIGSYCIRGDSLSGDTLPPIIVQDPIASPRMAITGVVTEERYKDLGIKSIVILPTANTGQYALSYASQKRATFSVPLIDSLQPVRAPISATDSAGNTSYDSLRYDPEPDNTAPVCSVESPDPLTRIFHVTELAPWDRGIFSVAIVGAATNLTIGPVVFTSVYQASQQFTVINKYLPASAIIRATDSAGHFCETTIYIDSLIRPLIPFTATNLVDFGTVYAPSTHTAQIQITNPNESQVLVTKLMQTGDNTIFSSDMSNPFVFAPNETKTFTITFTPTLLGNWRSDWTLANDTMQLTSIEAIGRSIGKIQIMLDTVNVPRTQLVSKVVVAIEATPAPINLDTISFTLDYDADMVSIQNPVNHITNYDLAAPNPLSPGRMQYQLTRKDRNLNSILTFDTSTIDLPFICLVAQHDTTLLHLENIFVSQLSTASYSPGMITVGAECGDKTLRDYLNGILPVFVSSVVPNPASGMITVTILAKNTGSAEISLINNLGEVKLRSNAALIPGINSATLDLATIPSGSYQLIVTAEGENISSQMVEVIR